MKTRDWCLQSLKGSRLMKTVVELLNQRENDCSQE